MIETVRFDFTLPTSVIFGEGTSELLADQVVRLGMERPLLVTDSFVAGTPELERAAKGCAELGVSVEVWDGVRPNAPDRSVEAGLMRYLEASCDGLIGYGGGSSIDTAKGIGVLASTDGVLSDYFLPDGAPVADLPPLLAVPTTAGTGSEVTHVAVIKDVEKGEKFAIRHPALRPSACIVDPLLTESMPPPLTIATGLDALSHALECFTSTRAGPISDVLAWRSLELIARALPEAIREGANLEARADMSLAATLAGIAFSNSALHIGHRLSKAITGRYHVPHGLACGLTMPAMLSFIESARAGKVTRIAQLFGSDDDLRVAETGAGGVCLRRWMDEVGVPTIEDATGGTAADIPELAAAAVARGPNETSPRSMDFGGYAWILERTFQTEASLGDSPRS